MRVETWEWRFYIIILSQSVEILSELWGIEHIELTSDLVDKKDEWQYVMEILETIVYCDICWHHRLEPIWMSIDYYIEFLQFGRNNVAWEIEVS